MAQAKVALSKDFMEAYATLPRNIQRKVRSFTEKFRRDPTQSGINFERINQAIDPKVRSVRIDQAYRAIIVHPPLGDVYLCVWVDHHDDAYDWARNRRFEVNPRSGTFQLFHMDEAGERRITRRRAVSSARGLLILVLRTRKGHEHARQEDEDSAGFRAAHGWNAQS